MNLEELKLQVASSLFNQLCTDVSGREIMRCVGVAEDHDDLYYLMKDINGKIHRHSAVTSPISIMAVDGVDQINKVFKLNGCSNADEILVIKEDILYEHASYAGTFLTECNIIRAREDGKYDIDFYDLVAECWTYREGVKKSSLWVRSGDGQIGRL